MKESIEGENESIAHGGPIYIPNLVGPLTRVPDFQPALLSELQNLQSELSLDSSELCDDIDLSVDELKIFSEEELVDMALKEAFKDGENTGSSPEPFVEHSNARAEIVGALFIKEKKRQTNSRDARPRNGQSTVPLCLVLQCQPRDVLALLLIMLSSEVLFKLLQLWIVCSHLLLF